MSMSFHYHDDREHAMGDHIHPEMWCVLDGHTGWKPPPYISFDKRGKSIVKDWEHHCNYILDIGNAFETEWAQRASVPDHRYPTDAGNQHLEHHGFWNPHYLSARRNIMRWPNHGEGLLVALSISDSYDAYQVVVHDRLIGGGFGGYCAFFWIQGDAKLRVTVWGCDADYHDEHDYGQRIRNALHTWLDVSGIIKKKHGSDCGSGWVRSFLGLNDCRRVPVAPPTDMPQAPPPKNTSQPIGQPQGARPTVALTNTGPSRAWPGLCCTKDDASPNEIIRRFKKWRAERIGGDVEWLKTQPANIKTVLEKSLSHDRTLFEHCLDMKSVPVTSLRQDRTHEEHRSAGEILAMIEQLEHRRRLIPHGSGEGKSSHQDPDGYASKFEL